MATLAIGISKSPSGDYTCKVPLASLSEDGVPPEQGDSVQYSVEGTVESVSGNEATVKIDSVNGEPVAEEGAESPAEEGQEPEEGTEEGASGAGATTPVAASGPADLGMAKRATSRIDRAGTDLLRNKLLKGARGRSLPF